jgi:putative oxidoreductase
MAVAAARHVALGDGFNGASHAIEAAVVFVGLFLTGPGKLRVRLPRLPAFWS